MPTVPAAVPPPVPTCGPRKPILANAVSVRSGTVTVRSAELTVSASWSSSDSPAAAAASAGKARSVSAPARTSDRTTSAGTSSSRCHPDSGGSGARHSTSRLAGSGTSAGPTVPRIDGGEQVGRGDRHVSRLHGSPDRPADQHTERQPGVAGHPTTAVPQPHQGSGIQPGHPPEEDGGVAAVRRTPRPEPATAVACAPEVGGRRERRPPAAPTEVSPS